MKNTVLALALLAVAAPWSHANITVPGANGTDGALNITANTEIDLAQAVAAQWDANNSANVGKGVYDAAQWAVVFKYTSVNIAAGATVTFKNHPTHAPVVWLVSGDVTIAGTVSLDGQSGQAFPNHAEPGPGGFRGGMEYDASVGMGSGFGPGGGQRGNWGMAASYGTQGTINNNGWSLPIPATYGNPSLIPLVGGSGGGAHDGRGERMGGGAGGGAMLIAATGTVTITGEVRANGGYGRTAGGAGGGIRIVATTLAGTGQLNAKGNTYSGWNVGGLGRIRLERVANTNTIATVPSPSIVPLADSTAALLWPPATAPKVEIVSIGGAAVPTDPKASFGTYGADVSIAQATTTPVVVRTTNVELASQVFVRATPRTGANYTEVAATGALISSTPLVVEWTATLPVSTGYSAVQVRVVRP